MVIKFKYTVDQQHIFKMYDIDREAKTVKKVKFCQDCGYFELNEVHIMSNGLETESKYKAHKQKSHRFKPALVGDRKLCFVCGFDEFHGCHFVDSRGVEPTKFPFKARNAISPAHYQAKGYELVDILEAFGLDKFSHRLQAIQYLFRAHVKGNELNDLKKAKWYIDREIDRIQEVWDHGRD